MLLWVVGVLRSAVDARRKALNRQWFGELPCRLSVLYSIRQTVISHSEALFQYCNQISNA